MNASIGADARLALDLALTIRHDGHGGVADDLTTAEGLTAWVRERPETGAHGFEARGFVVDDTDLAAVREVRAAVRALFARAVLPGEPSPADAARLMPVRDAVERLNTRAALAPTVPVLSWTEGADPVVRQEPAHGDAELTAALARAAIAFLASPDRQRLRACHAPRCVRYFLKDHPRQEWCKPSCGNRARVARHHERHKKTA
ncbi:CGNR zinc finger domain-containing protein [Streptomyces sp. NPDC057199]|uniref:CGNR zinc finger domain-containing protein n=1 Tax=Streptomyces sp. NPDC057199 TaxID=3346047 RepID=UPI00363CAF0D